MFYPFCCIIFAKDKKSLDFAINFDRKFFNNKRSHPNILIDILNSPNKEEYLKNIMHYKSYLRLNRKNGDAISVLDKLIENGQYDEEVYDAKLAARNIMGMRIPSRIFTESELERLYVPEGEEFLNEFFGQYYPRRGYDISEVTKQDILSMYHSSDPKNMELRLRIMNKFMYVEENSPEGTAREIASMRVLFDRMDASKDAYQFVQDLLDYRVKIHSIQELEDILAVVPPKKANIFHDNIYRIIKGTDEGQERRLALETQVTNPFFTTQKLSEFEKSREESIHSGFYSREPKFSKLRRKISNIFCIVRYKFFGKNDTQSASVEPKKYTGIFITSIEDALSHSEEIPVLNLAQRLSQSPKSRKLRVISDVKEVIRKRLHSKTYEKQEEAYAKKATKMRLKLLPEIFDSIKETRAADRAVGKLKSNSSNKDALTLYNKIDGKNRKLVRYMLMKRNTDGSRMFEVADIIDFLNKAERSVEKAKIKNPKLPAVQVKAYYEHLYRAKIEQYGELKTPKKSKKFSKK